MTHPKLAIAYLWFTRRQHRSAIPRFTELLWSFFLFSLTIITPADDMTDLASSRRACVADWLSAWCDASDEIVWWCCMTWRDVMWWCVRWRRLQSWMRATGCSGRVAGSRHQQQQQHGQAARWLEQASPRQQYSPAQERTCSLGCDSDVNAYDINSDVIFFLTIARPGLHVTCLLFGLILWISELLYGFFFLLFFSSFSYHYFVSFFSFSIFP